MARKIQKKKKASKAKKTKQSTKNLLWHVLSLLVVALLTLWTYSEIDSHEFTNWDDNLYVTENPYVLNFEEGGLKDIFKSESNVAGNYHPVTVWSLARNYDNNKFLNSATGRYEVEAKPFLITNKYLHLVNALLIYLFAFILSKGRIDVSLFCAAVFAVHPMHVESVAWVSGRKDLLYTLFFVASLISYLLYTRQKKWAFLLLSLVLFIPSLLSKPAAVVLPLLLFVMDYFENRKLNLRTIIEKLPFLAGSIIIGIITIGTQTESEAVAEFGAFSLWERFVFASYGFVTYIVKFFVPNGLSPFHPYPSNKEFDFFFNLYPFIALAILIGTFWFLRKQKALFFGIAFYLIGLILVLQFISVGNAIIAERYTYLPYFGLSFALAWYLGDFLKSKIKKSYLPVMLGLSTLLCVAFAFKAKSQTKSWAGTLALWTNVIDTYPEKQSKAYNNRGIYYKDNQQFQEAIADYDKGIIINSNNHLLFNSRGNVYKSLSEREKDKKKKNEYIKASISDLSQAVTIRKDHFQSWNSLGLAYLVLKDFDKALKSFNKALEVNPNYHKVHVNLASYYLQLDEYENALAEYELYLSILPGDIQILSGKAFAFYRLKRYEEAHKLAMRCLNADPTNRQYLYLSSLTHQSKALFERALKDALRAKELGHQVPPSHIRKLRNQVKNG